MSSNSVGTFGPCCQRSLNMCRFARPPQYRKPLAGAFQDLPKQLHCRGMGGLQVPIQWIRFCRLHGMKAHETTSNLPIIYLVEDLIKKPERSTPKDINPACTLEASLFVAYACHRLFAGFRWLGFTSSRKSSQQNHARVANRFLLRDNKRKCWPFWLLARWSRARARHISLRCSLGDLGRRLPEKGLQPAHPGSNSSAFTSGFRRTLRYPR
jgi:hypothetical protein